MANQPSNPEAPYQGNAAALLTPQALERWRDIVGRAAVQGADVAQLVQHFAERAFENKSLGLDQQGSQRRALANLKQVILREIERAKAALKLCEGQKTANLKRPYNSVKIEFTPPQGTLAQQTHKRSTRLGEPPLSSISDAHAWTIKPISPALISIAQLQSYVRALEQQSHQTQTEVDKLDLILNKGLTNQARTVADLGAAAKELYRIAQEVVQALPQGAIKTVADASQPASTRGAKAQTLEDEPTAAMPLPAPRPFDEEATQTMVGDAERRTTDSSLAPQNATQPPVVGAMQDFFRRLTDRARGGT